MIGKSDEAILSDLRVLDLGGEMGAYCGKLLADLGAEVIKIEPPGGDHTRRNGPFLGDDPHPEKSLYWFYFNTNKKSITLDIATADGKEIFRKLAAKSDVIIETFAPGYMEGLGLGFEDLRKENPGLIMTSITPFGQTGPYRDYKASDIVGVAMAGQMYLAGMQDGPPVQAGGEQGYSQANLHAAVGTFIALHVRDSTGQGQQVDVSMQESATLAMETAMQYWDLDKDNRHRMGVDHRMAAYGTYPCMDGHISLLTGLRGWEQMVAWMNEEGHGLELAGKEWLDIFYRAAHADEADGLIIPWLLEHTKQELVDRLQASNAAAMPVCSPKDLVESPQLNARDFFVPVHHPALNATLKYPGAPYRFDQIQWRIAQPAPAVGEHNIEIFGELGLSRQDIVALKGAGAI